MPALNTTPSKSQKTTRVWNLQEFAQRLLLGTSARVLSGMITDLLHKVPWDIN